MVQAVVFQESDNKGTGEIARGNSTTDDYDVSFIVGIKMNVSHREGCLW